MPSKPCRNFVASGQCKFGDRCSFLHDAAIPSLQQPSAVPQKAESEGDWEDIEDEYDGAKNVGSLTGRSTAAVGGDAAGVLVLDWSNMNQLRSVEEPLATSNGSAQKNSIQSHREARTASYRTRICRHFLRGTCQMGDKCNFSHTDVSDAQVGSPSVADAAPSAPRKGPHKVTPCHFFFSGVGCKRADCTFSHESPIKSTGKAASAPSGVTSAHTSHPLYKTQPCVYFKEGKCGKGEACTFQHDAQADPAIECKFFLKTGRCDFGSNCRYRHPISSTDGTPPLPSSRKLVPKPRLRESRQIAESSLPIAAASSTVDEEDDELIEVMDSDDEDRALEDDGDGDRQPKAQPGGWEADVGELLAAATGHDEDELDRLFTQMGV